MSECDEEMAGQNVAMRGALEKIEAALRKDSRQKSITGDEVEYHLDGGTMHLAINAAREALASTGWPSWLIKLALFVGKSSASMGAMEAYRAIPASLRRIAEQEGKDAAS